MNSGSVALGKIPPAARRLWAPVRAAGRGGNRRGSAWLPQVQCRLSFPSPPPTSKASKSSSQNYTDPSHTRTSRVTGADTGGAVRNSGEGMERAQQSCVVCHPTGRQSH